MLKIGLKPGKIGHFGHFLIFYKVVNNRIKWLTPYTNCNYLAVKLNGDIVSVARIITSMFVKNYDPAKSRVFHLDGDYANNKADNLVWVKPSDVKHLWVMDGVEERKRYLNSETQEETDL